MGDAGQPARSRWRARGSREARTARPLRVTLPGPFALSGRFASGPAEVYPTRVAAAETFVPILVLGRSPG